MNHNLIQLPLRPSTIEVMEQHGFATTRDIDESKGNGGMSNLAAELECSLIDAAAYCREIEKAVGYVSSSNATQESTAHSILLSRKASLRYVLTACKSIDDMFNGGIMRSEVTEVVGLPGAGKTQLAMQLCVNARLPFNHGGVEGESIYIDSEGSFSPERCYSMAKALVHQVKRVPTRQTPNWFNPETILDGIHVYHVHDEPSQTATIYSLPSFMEKRAEMGTPVRIVVIDSIAFHYRCLTDNFLARTQSLISVAAFLSDLAHKHDVAVVVVNQMTTKIESSNTSRHVPALGESWAHATTTRILLQEHGGQRQCSLLKSPHRPAGTAWFTVNDSGIRDVPFDKENRNPNKRHKVG